MVSYTNFCLRYSYFKQFDTNYWVRYPDTGTGRDKRLRCRVPLRDAGIVRDRQPRRVTPGYPDPIH
jgi:hypothetical protein